MNRLSQIEPSLSTFNQSKPIRVDVLMKKCVDKIARKANKIKNKGGKNEYTIH